MKKFDFRAGLSFGIFMIVLTIIQNFWLADDMTFSSILKVIMVSTVAGAFGGFFYGLIVGILKSSKRLYRSVVFTPNLNEEIDYQVPASYLLPGEGVGGVLYVTNRRLLFKPHKWNIHKKEVELYLKEIAETKKYRPIGIFNNGIKVTSKANWIGKFIVDDPDKLKSVLS